MPLAQTTFALTMLNPCKLAVVFDFCGLHCPDADAPVGVARSSHPTTTTATSFMLYVGAAHATLRIPTSR